MKNETPFTERNGPRYGRLMNPQTQLWTITKTWYSEQLKALQKNGNDNNDNGDG